MNARISHTVVYKKDGNVYTFGAGEDGELGNGENFNYAEAQLVGNKNIQTNTAGITIKKAETFDIDAYIKYFNLFEDKSSVVSYEIIDPDLAMLDAVSRRNPCNETRKNNGYSKRNRNRQNCSNTSKDIRK